MFVCNLMVFVLSFEILSMEQKLFVIYLSIYLSIQVDDSTLSQPVRQVRNDLYKLKDELGKKNKAI